MTDKLAMLGGEPYRTKPMPVYNSLGPEEANAAMRVMESGLLSGFYGCYSDEFYGGPEVQALEREWEAAFSAKYAVSVNSATSALYAALAAIDVGPGDEVICPPTTMCASVTGVLIQNAVPVFADIEEDRHCLDPQSVEKHISPRTKAIMVVQLFGQAADMDGIMALAKKHDLYVIEDAAQAPLAYYKGRPVGTIGDIGIFSLNCHKTIQCGEGGIAVTNDDDLALRMQLVRNHGEQVFSEGLEPENKKNILGYNYRLTELQAAIAREQLKKLPKLNADRQELVAYLREQLAKYEFFDFAPVREGCTHVYYVPVWNYHKEKLGISRETLLAAVNAEGFPASHFCGAYVLPIYRQKLYQDPACHPFALRCAENQPLPSYDPAQYPVAESLWKELFIETNFCTSCFTKADIDDFIAVIDKVVANIDLLQEYEAKQQ